MKKNIKLFNPKIAAVLFVFFIFNCSIEDEAIDQIDDKVSVKANNNALRTTISNTASIIIQAENYDNMSGVQTENTADSGGGQNVGWIDTGDYLEYDLNVPNAGSYKFEFRVASLSNNSKFDFYQNTKKLSNVNKTTTGGWQNWVTTSKTVDLSAGNSTLKLLATGSGWNINWIKITPIDVNNGGAVTNLALNKPATQSSTGYGGVASRAVDGNTSGIWNQNSVTHTNSTYRPWWQVQLGANYNIGDIKIWNRTNCCSNRLSNFDVFVYNSSGAQVFKTTITSTPSPSITINTGGVTGSRVRVKLKDTNPLSLAEVQVFALGNNGSNGGNDNGSGNLDPNKAPSENFDLSTWKITLSSGNEKTVDELNNGYELSNQFYTGSDGGMVFKNYPKGAGTTTNSTYSRVELRELLYGDNKSASAPENNWYFSSSSNIPSNAGGIDGVMEATLKVNRVTTTSGSTSQIGRVIIGQIHASGDEPLRLYYHKQPGHAKGAIYFAHEPSSGDEVFENMLGNYVDETGSSAGDYTGAGSPSNGIALNEEFSYKIEVNGNTLYVTIYNASGNAISSKTYNMSSSGFNNDWMYFKAGLYSGNKSVVNTSDYEQVTFYRLEKSHN